MPLRPVLPLALLSVACAAEKATPTTGSGVPTDPTPTTTTGTPGGDGTATGAATGSAGSDSTPSGTPGTTTGTATVGTATGPVVASGCGGYGLSTYSVAVPTQPELHLIGVYQPDGGGAIDVDLQRGGDQIVVLSSYAAVQWNLTAAPGVNVTQVVLNGYELQGLTGFAGPVDNRSPAGNWLGAYGYAWPAATGGSDTAALVQAVEQLTGLTLTSFTGCYESAGFRLQ